MTRLNGGPGYGAPSGFTAVNCPYGELMASVAPATTRRATVAKLALLA